MKKNFIKKALCIYIILCIGVLAGCNLNNGNSGDNNIKYNVIINKAQEITEVKIDNIEPSAKYTAGTYELTFNTLENFSAVVKVNDVEINIVEGTYVITITKDTIIDITVIEDTTQPSKHLIIHQIYGIGNKNNDAQAGSNSFIELYNPTNDDINLSGYSIQAASTGNVWEKLNLTGVIPSKHSFLIVLTMYVNSTEDSKLFLKITKYDLEWKDVFFVNKTLKVCLLSNTNALSVSNPFDLDGEGTKAEGYIDMLSIRGNDSTSPVPDGYETAYLEEQSKQKALRRINFTDTDNNAQDAEIIDYRETKNLIYRPRSLIDGSWTDIDDQPPAVDDTLFSVKTSRPSGMYEAEFNLKLFVESSPVSTYDIYYTTDCTNPLTSSTRIKYSDSINITDRSSSANVYSARDPSTMNQFYSGKTIPFNSNVPKCFTLRAIAVAGDHQSKIINASYFVGTSSASFTREFKNNQISLISVITDPDNLFDYNNGIYVNGYYYDKDKNTPGVEPQWIQANYRQKGREWERPVYIDFFENNGEYILGQNCGMRIQGGYSRGDIQKSLRFYARDEYQEGADNFEYGFFDEVKDSKGNKLEKLKKLIARTGANDAFYCKFADVLHQSLIRDRNLSIQDGRACIVFLEGEYWGLYTLQQDFNDDYFASHYGVDKDQVIMVKADDQYTAKLEEGTTSDLVSYDNMVKWFETADLSVQAQYEQACQYIDVDSFIDYAAFEMFIRNEDWPGKNWACWRTRNTDSSNIYADGKWRFCVYDTEMGSDHYGNASTKYYDNTAMRTYNDSGTNIALFYRKFMKSAQFKTKLAEVLEHYANDEFEKTKVSQKITQLSNIYSQTEMNRTLQRFPVVWQSINERTNRISRMSTFFNGRNSYVLNTMIPWINNINNFI
mgnify:CR=1 FL=1